jgi:hypothetical protein
MLALVTIFLVTILISLVAVWIYRKLFAWEGSSSVVAARRGKTAKMKLKPQRGFVSLFKSSKAKKPTSRGHSSRASSSRARVKPARLRQTAGTIKAPWGW